MRVLVNWLQFDGTDPKEYNSVMTSQNVIDSKISFKPLNVFEVACVLCSYLSSDLAYYQNRVKKIHFRPDKWETHDIRGC